MRDPVFKMLLLTMGPKALNAWSVYRDHPEMPPDVKTYGDEFALQLSSWIAKVRP